MPVRYSKYIKLIHIIGDVAAIAISIGAAFALDSTKEQPSYLISLLCSLLGWFICTVLLGTYHIYRTTTRIRVVVTALKALLLYVVLLEAGLNISGTQFIERHTLVYHYCVLVGLIVLWRISVTTALRIYRREGYNLRKVIIAGHNEMAQELKHFFKAHPEFGYKFLGSFHNNTDTNDRQYIGKISDIEEFVKKNEVDEVYCCPFDLTREETSWLINFADNNLLRVKFLPEPGSYTHQQFKIDFYDILPVLIVRSIPLDDAINQFFKRSFDIVFSLTIITLLLSWLLPVLALLIKLNSKGPVLFKQVRSGLDNKPFYCFKLRTMYVNTRSNSQLAKRGDSRITPIGAFLRKTSLDELPQFFNVLLGQMSIVGPRPHMLKADEEYAMVAEKYKVRHFVKPGITGLSQVRGYRGDTTETYQVRGRIRLDIFYLENWSFYLDLKIIFYTVYNVIKGDKHAF
ncbi:undecaprenyl-phosphate glucose phosphotransferase [Pontibacter actiniarum]|uniref:Undecaprenyl-phosphate glucose phosphotransferase n=2 Tax=Pontibacter actiniarum TaxID=323450 RepID=A0A1X9YY66_9BACT|nr:undecaprenyl-phosphate glucose phosphotransferase [Pontibacter actiniarum]